MVAGVEVNETTVKRESRRKTKQNKKISYSNWTWNEKIPPPMKKSHAKKFQSY